MEHMFTRLEWLVGKEKLENLGTKSVPCLVAAV